MHQDPSNFERLPSGGEKCPQKQPKMPIFAKIDFRGLQYHPEVLIELKTRSTLCGAHVQTILNHKDLTGSAVGVREGQNTEQYGAIWGNFLPYFDLPTHTLLTRSNYYGSK